MEENNIGEIEDVSQGTTAYLRLHKKTFFLIISSCIIFGVLISWIAYAYESINILKAIVLPIAIPFIYIGYGRSKVQHLFIQQFAKENNFEYAEYPLIKEQVESHYLQSIGHDQAIVDVVTGTYQTKSFRFYTFRSTVGYGKGSHQVTASVFEMQSDGQVLDIILDNGKLESSQFFSGKKKLQVEGDFNKHYVIYVPAGYEIETLEILTPDIMEYLAAESDKLSFEFINNKLFIIFDGEINNKKDLNKVFAFSEFLIEKLGPVLSSLHKD